jgi:hypothetical protein
MLTHNLWCAIYTMSNLVKVAPNLGMARRVPFDLTLSPKIRL